LLPSSLISLVGRPRDPARWLADEDLPAVDLIAVLDGTPTRLKQAERYRQQLLQEPGSAC